MGRGINVVIFDPKTKEVVKSGRFDTYELSKLMMQNVTIIIIIVNLSYVFVIFITIINMQITSEDLSF